MSGIARRQPKSGTRAGRGKSKPGRLSRPPRPLVVDTNVLLSVVSIHDVSKEAGLPEREPMLQHRRETARSALLLVCYCHQRRVRTLSIEELSVLLRARVPPDADGLEGNFVRHFLYFVKDYVLPKWDFQRVNGTEALTGNQADDEYLRIAKEEKLVLVTHEGLTAAGVESRPRSLRRKAAAAGVSVRTAEELLVERGVDEAALTAGFFQRWDAAAPKYVRDHASRHGRDEIATWMTIARATYEWTLASPKPRAKSVR